MNPPAALHRTPSAGPAHGRTRADVHPDVVAAMDEFVRRLSAMKGEFPPIVRVLLYGSHARGDFREGSDVDVAVVFDGPDNEALLWQLGPCHPDMPPTTPTTMYALPILKERMDDPETTMNPDFYRNVQRDGIDWPIPA